jgi:hypothetical protein
MKAAGPPVDTGEGIMFKRALTTVDLAGSGSSGGTAKEMKAKLDWLRDEDA